ncbi:MAG: hypothetical protein AAGI38_09630 [Bacteroidota bacterium]
MKLPSTISTLKNGLLDRIVPPPLVCTCPVIPADLFPVLLNKEELLLDIQYPGNFLDHLSCELSANFLVLVDENGRFQDCQLTWANDDLFARLNQQLLTRMSFFPAIHKGKSFSHWVEIEISLDHGLFLIRQPS